MQKKVQVMKFQLLRGGNIHDETLPPKVKAIIDACKSMPDGTIADLLQFGDMYGFTYSELRHSISHPAVRPFKMMDSRYAILGNETTIEAYRNLTPVQRAAIKRGESIGKA